MIRQLTDLPQLSAYFTSEHLLISSLSLSQSTFCGGGYVLWIHDAVLDRVIPYEAMGLIA